MKKLLEAFSKLIDKNREPFNPGYLVEPQPVPATRGQFFLILGVTILSFALIGAVCIH